MPIDQFDRVLHQVAQSRRIGGMAQRHGYVHEVKEGGGERKCRLVLGFGKDGKPWLSPWLNTEEHRGGSSSQQLVEKGQSFVMTCHNGDYRNATLSPSGESISNPQPPHAPQFNGDTSSNGSKVRTATNKPSQQSSGGTSLLGTTEVLTANGFKNIKDLQLGDRILSYPVNAAVRKPVEDTVIGLQQALSKKPVYELTYAGGKLCCTGDHHIWTEGRNSYTAADKLGFVDKLRSYDNTLAIIALLPLEAKEWTVYDLTIETNGNFYAREGSSGEAVLVHNAGGGGGGSDTHSVWIDNQKEQRQQHQEQTGQYEQSGGGGSSSQQGQQGQQSSKPDPLVISHLNDDGSATIRHKDKCRLTVGEKGPVIRTKADWVFVDDEAKMVKVSKPPVIGKCTQKDNNSV